MAIKTYSWGKAAQNGNKRNGNGSTKLKSKVARSGAKKTKKLR